MNDYTQPFWVGRNNPRFPYARGGYLPALDTPEPQPEVVPQIHHIPVETELTKANTARQMRQIRGELASIRNKFNELSQSKTKVHKY